MRNCGQIFKEAKKLKPKFIEKTIFSLTPVICEIYRNLHVFMILHGAIM